MSGSQSMSLSGNCSSAADDQFGPAVASCRRSFDFTLLFEQSILLILPACMLMLLAPARLWQLRRAQVKTTGLVAGLMKAVVASGLAFLWLTLVVLTTLQAAVRTRVALSASIMGFLASTTVFGLSCLEHRRSVRPSMLLCLYLALSALFDAVQVRSLFLLGDATAVAAVYTACLGMKMILLFLEAQEKRAYLRPPYANLPLESTIGIFNRSVFWWLNGTFLLGFKKILSSLDLQEIDHRLSSQIWGHALQSAWSARVKCTTGSHALVWTALYTFRRLVAAMIFPRLLLIAFTYAQPFLITSLLTLLSETPAQGYSSEKGYGLIGATALIYVGIAVWDIISTGFYRHLLFRLITAFRGAMVTLIFDKTLDLREGAYSESSALTLMSTDVDRICLSLERFQEVWANLIEVIVGVTLLGLQLGWVSVLPLAIVVVSTLLNARVSKLMPAKQKVWAAAVQQRITVTASCLGSMKAIRMLGLSETTSTILREQRSRELKLMAGFRWMSLWLNVIANLPSAFASAVTFLAFALQALTRGGNGFDTVHAFTSLALIQLVTGPAGRFLSAFPILAASLGCFDRIQQYLLAPSREDCRVLIDDTSDENSMEKEVIPDVGGRGQLQLKLVENPDYLTLAIQDGEFRPAAGLMPVCKDINIEFHRGALTIIAGPIGSGKTTIVKGLLGEIPCGFGSISTRCQRISYCRQTPWLLNATIQQNVVGEQTGEMLIDDCWYRTVLLACALEPDLQLLADGDRTMVGSKGSKLSGGQKQRIALARCVYARPQLMVLDDAFSALDSQTESMVANRLFGSSGILRQLGTTTVLVTHSARILHFADKIVSLTSDGAIKQQGSYDELRATLGDLHQSLSLTNEDEDKSPATTIKKSEQGLRTNQGLASDSARRYGDLTDYSYYAKFVGWHRGLTYISFQALHIFSVCFPQLWLMWWAAADGKEVAKYLTVYVAFSFLQLINQGIAIWSILVWIAAWSANELHGILLRTVMRASQSFFTETDSGTILNRFSQDLTLVEQALPMALMFTIGMLFMVLGQLAFISLGSAYMAISLPFVFVILYLLQSFYLRTSRQIRLLDLEAKSPIYSHFQETLDGIATIRAFGWQDKARASNLLRLEVSQKPYYLLFCIQRWLNLVLDLIIAGMAVIVVALAVNVRESSSTGQLGVSLNNLLGASGFLSAFINAWTQLETSIGAISRIKSFEAYTTPESQDSVMDRLDKDWPRYGSIEFRNVTATYGNIAPTLNAISMSIAPGQKVGVCGRTGSGKSSLLSALMRLLDLQSGSIIIDEVDLSRVERETLRSRITAVPQDPFLRLGSVRLNVDPASSWTDEAVISALIKTRLWPILQERGGLNCDLAEYPLSQGQQQLLSLARAMLRESKVLILDEATSSVDAVTDKLIQQVIRDEFRDSTIISVAHRLDSILDADRVAVLDKGRLVEYDTPQSLLQKESMFRKLYEG